MPDEPVTAVQLAPQPDAPEGLQATVVVLCRDNPAALTLTLMSLLSQRLPSEALVMDGSSDWQCRAVWQGFQSRLRNPELQNAAHRLRYIHQKPQGIYVAMNAAIPLVTTPWLMFLHAGDRFADALSLQWLVSHAQHLDHHHQRPPAAVFGQAWIEADLANSRESLRWLSPNPRMKNLQRWLRHMVPCHQSVLFCRSWALQHLYDTRSSICADRAVIRQALKSSGSKIYLPQPVCCYRLDGVSSQLPDWLELQRRWREPGRRFNERLGELGKWLLRPLGAHYPKLMQIRAMIFGWLC